MAVLILDADLACVEEPQAVFSLPALHALHTHSASFL